MGFKRWLMPLKTAAENTSGITGCEYLALKDDRLVIKGTWLYLDVYDIPVEALSTFLNTGDKCADPLDLTEEALQSLLSSINKFQHQNDDQRWTWQWQLVRNKEIGRA